MNKHLILLTLILFSSFTYAQVAPKLFPGADEKTPSRAQYFSWINNTNEGATTAQTLINLDFFKWLKDTYGMQLDIYAFDAGAIDGKNFYGSMKSDRFKTQFSQGFGPIADKAFAMNTRLGIWGGPDGFGNTPEEEKQRIETQVSLCRDFHFELFKMDAVCGQLRPEKFDAFDRMMTECRKYSPDLVLLNHRLNLGEKGTAHSTTFLLGGAETYIDVHMANAVTAPHHRVTALSRELPPKLTRLTEDHGVCLSSCLDYWEDDLILQAFNRNLILAPEIYGNPWLLRDDEYPILARIYNLTRQYSNILVNGMVLPEKEYGLNAVSRGDDHTRLITLRNLSWNPKSFTIKLDETVGLKKSTKVLVKTYHPTEKIVGKFTYGSTVNIEVLPFRSCLIKLADAAKETEFGVEGIDYQVDSELPGKPMEIKLLAFPGTEKNIRLTGNTSAYKTASIDGKPVSGLLNGKSLKIHFEGEPFKNSFHRKIADLTECTVPADAEAIYESTCFAADNNALEVRELKRSGETTIPQVQAARKAFFEQDIFVERELWDKNLFDGNLKTAFSVGLRWGGFEPDLSAFRLDLGQEMELDSLLIQVPDEFSLSPLKSQEGEYALVSNDLKTWKNVFFMLGKTSKIDLSASGKIRFLKLQPGVLRISEITGYKNGKMLDRLAWRASNLFRSYVTNHWNRNLLYKAQKTWSAKFKLEEVPSGSYLCIAVNGEHGVEGAFAGAKIDGRYVGCPDRAPSFKSNSWEVGVRSSSKNYTYYIPLDKSMVGKEIETFVMGMNPTIGELKPEVYITAYPTPYSQKVLVIK
ncbi:MAG: discoidin domain-containing protein [Mariniphaga sp.]|nr:discoidin domain-containing protein [Mariniphaga sp.]